MPEPTPLMLESFEQLAKHRRSIRHFDPRAVADELLMRLLDCARWAPSGYNLQPTHFVLVSDLAIKMRLFTACMSQRQIVEAPTIVVFVGDRRAFQHNAEAMLAQERAAESISPEYETLLRRVLPLAFSHAPAGLGWLWKALLIPVAAIFRPVPSIPAVHQRFWLAKQVALAAMNFMLAAEAAGLATVPMEGFDERRVRRLLGIPRWCIVPIIVPVGYAADRPAGKTRLPLAGMTHRDRW
ncbi:MAG: nitroreductase family protein [Phycisphaerales bacterium]|nr:nitroreductase family protein [Phycisphaerales bacterium]